MSSNITPYEEKDYKGTKELSLRRGERDLIVKALNKRRIQRSAAKKLGISSHTLWKKIQRHRIEKDDEGQYYSKNKEL